MVATLFRNLLIMAAVAAPSALAQTNLCETYASLVKAQPSSIEGSTAHIYKSVNGADLRLHVFTPELRGAGKLPAIVFFFGGGWMWGDVTTSLPQAKYLAGRGMVTVLVDYRVYCRNKVDVTEEMEDAKSAIRWIRSHASELGVDPNRIAASGASSGGHLALSTAAFSSFDDPASSSEISSRPNALVLFAPCVDASTDDERQYSSAALGSHGKDVSPLYHLAKGLPPMIIFQGTADSLYPSVNQYCNEAKALGNSCEFFKYEDAPHGFFNPAVNQGKWYRQALLETDRFLTKRGYLKGPSPTELR